MVCQPREFEDSVGAPGPAHQEFRENVRVAYPIRGRLDSKGRGEEGGVTQGLKHFKSTLHFIQ